MKVVQVPMEDHEADSLASLARSLRISRADLIRKACRRYVEGIHTARLDQEYEAGYRRTPEDPAVGTTSASLAPSVLSVEDWSS